MSELLFDRIGPDNSIATVTFNRPEARNALTWGMYAALEEACETVDHDDTIKVLILQGAGDKAFVSGTDISQFTSFTQDRHAIEYEQKLERLISRLELVKKPVIAAIQGFAVGAGAALALVSDLRYCTPDSRIGFPIARTLGNCLTVAIHARIVDAIGPARTKELMFRAKLVEAQQALQLGLVNEIFESAQLSQQVQRIAQEISRNAPITLQVTKEAVRRLQQHRRAIGADILGEDLVVRAYMSEDFREGVDAFLSKTQTSFSREVGSFALRLNDYSINALANPSNSPMLMTSVAVVRNMLEAVAGSAPNFLRKSGISVPNIPLAIQLPIMASTTTMLSVAALLLPVLYAYQYITPAGNEPDDGPVKQAKKRLFTHRTEGTFFRQFPERQPPQRYGQGLTTRISRLTSKDRQKDSKDHDLLNRFFEQSYHCAGDKCCEQINL